MSRKVYIVASLSRKRKLQVDADLAKRDPWELPRFPFIMAKEAASNLRTDSGYWTEKKNKLTAVRYQGIGKEQKLTEGHDQGKDSSSASPSYIGIKRTLVFCDKDGTESDWILHEYQLLDTHKTKPGLVLKEDLVTRKVFKNCSDGDGARQLSNKSNSAQLPRVVSEKKRKLYQANPQSGQEPSGSGECLHTCAPRNGETEALREGESSSGPAASCCKKESDVWQYFTKIYSNDPEPVLVQAICHGCDKVIKAHSKIDGTSHLKKHILACSSSTHNLSCSAEDQKILQDLRQAQDLYTQENTEINADIAKLDPWDPKSIPSYFTSSLSRETHQGCWKEIRKRCIAIRTNQLRISPPPYGGVKTTLQFHRHDGNKMAYIMIEFQLVNDYRPPHLILQGGVVFRKVFQNHKDMVSDSLSELDRGLNVDDDEEEEHYKGMNEDEVQAYTITLQDCLVAGVDQSGSGKHKRTTDPNGGSDVWLHLTRIYNANHKRVYAVCHCCDKCFSGLSENGTSHLRSHIKTCLLKYQELPRHNEADTE